MFYLGEFVKEKIDFLQYLTNDIRDKEIPADQKIILLEGEGAAPQYTRIMRSKTKGGTGRAYFQCPLCRSLENKVTMLYYPFSPELGISSKSWQCRKCLERTCYSIRWATYERTCIMTRLECVPTNE